MNAKNLNIQGGPAEEPGPVSGEELQKEIEALAREAAAKGMIEAAKIQAGQALLKILDETPLKEKGASKAREQESADSADLSNESLAYNRRSEEEIARQRELERLLSQLWKALEEWQPRPELGLEQELKQLNAVYQKLLQEILRLYPQSQAGIQTDRINSLLLEIIDRMSSQRFPALLEMLGQYGKSGVQDNLMASVLEKILGRTVPPQEVRAARAYRKMGEAREKSAGQKGGKGGGGSLGTEGGILYHREKGNRIGTNQGYREKVQAQERLHFQGTEKGPAAEGTGYQPLGGKAYSVGDIEGAERFLRYMKGEGNLYTNPGITAANEELLGFVMALNMAKLEIFTEYSGIGKEMAWDVRDTLDRFFRFYLEETVRTQASREGVGAARAPDGRSIQQMYYRVTELIQCMKTPEKGIWKGLLYAWETFWGKKDREEFKKFRRYEKEAGFFLNSMGDKDRHRELLWGAEILDKDWRKFLASIGQKDNALLQLMLENCPWGMAAEGEEAQDLKTDKGAPGGLLLWGAGLCALLALAGFIFGGRIF